MDWERYGGKVGLLVVPLIMFLCVFYLYPLIRLVPLSLDAPGLSLKHYIAFFTESIYARVLFKTIYVSILVTIICLFIGYPTAYVLAWLKGRLRNFLLLFVIIPYLTSFLVRTYAWVILLSDRGLVNSLLINMGLIETPVKLVYNTVGVYIGMVHVMLPLMILPLYSVMRGIDMNLVRAAQSLGAGPFLSFRRVFLPLSLPGVQSGCLLVFLISLGFYITPAMLGGLRDVMIVNLIDIQVIRMVNWEFGAAASFILLLSTLAVFIISGRMLGAANIFTIDKKGASVISPVRDAEKDARGRGWKSLFWAALNPLFSSASLNAIHDRLSGWIFNIKNRRRLRFEKKTTPPLNIGRIVLFTLAGMILFYLLVPTLVVIPMSFNSAEFLSFPPPGLSLKWYKALFQERGWVAATILSFEVGFAATFFATVLGTLAAYGLVRSTFRYRPFVMALIISPIVIPPIVVGVAIYGLLADWGLIGKRTGLVIAHSIGAISYIVVIVTATLSRFDFSLERASMSMGAGPIRTFRKVTLPLIRPGIIAGAIFAFIHSFDELVITMLIAGIYSQTLPLKIWENIRFEISPIIAAISTILVFLPLVWLIILEITRKVSTTRGIGRLTLPGA